MLDCAGGGLSTRAGPGLVRRGCRRPVQIGPRAGG